MPEITLNYAHNGGTNRDDRSSLNDYCLMGNDLLLNATCQTSPYHVVAYTTKITNLKTGTYSAVRNPMRFVLKVPFVPPVDGFPRSLRLFKLSARFAALAVDGDFYVLEVRSDGTVVPKNARSVGVGERRFTTANQTETRYFTVAQQSGQTGESSTGAAWMAFTARENVLYVVNRPKNPSTSVTMKKVQYNPATDSFAITNILSVNIGNTSIDSSSLYYFMVTDIPNSSSKLFQIRHHATGVAYQADLRTSRTKYAAVISATDVITPINGIPSNTVNMCALTPTTVVAMSSTLAYTTWNGTSFVGSATIDTQGFAPVSIYYSEAFDANTFITFSDLGTGGYDISDPSDAVYIRINRYNSPTSGSVSPGTKINNGNGISFRTTGTHKFDQKFIFRHGSDAMLILGRSGVLPHIHVLYNPIS